jgi:hypothetical protein
MPPAAARSRPLGFILCGVMSMCFSALALLLLVAAETEGGSGAAGVVTRGAAVLLLSLGLITTEALWKARPWAYPASLALAVSYFVSLSAVGALVAVEAPDSLWWAGLVLGVSAVMVIPMLRYIRHHSRRAVAAGGRPRPRSPAMRGTMRPRTPFDAVCPAGFGTVALQCRPGGRGARTQAAPRAKKYPRPWTLKDGILAWTSQVDPSLPGY